jgi:molybdate transport system substrate-binding protein
VSLTFVSCQKNKDSEIVIFAASSLTNAIGEISDRYEKEEEIDIMSVFAGSNTLKTQIENGAYADVFISANEAHYKSLYDQGYVMEGKKILANEMVLIVSNDSDSEINNLEDLKKKHCFITATDGVPAGVYARHVLSNLTSLYGEAYLEAVENNIVSQEINVRQVLMKVVLGEGDAAIVYRTDITEDVEDAIKIIEIPEGYNIEASYWIGLVKHDDMKEKAKAYVEYLSDKTSEAIFKKYKFDIVRP